MSHSTEATERAAAAADKPGEADAPGPASAGAPAPATVGGPEVGADADQSASAVRPADQSAGTAEPAGTARAAGAADAAATEKPVAGEVTGTAGPAAGGSAPSATEVAGAGATAGPAGQAAGAAVRYTLARFGVFLASFVVIAALAYVGVLPESFGAANPLWIALLAIIVSAPVSYVVLRRQRDALSQQIVPRIEHAKGLLRANQSMEDDAV